MQRLATTIFVTALAAMTLMACDAIPGFGKQEAQPAPVVQQAPVQQVAAPVQPAAAQQIAVAQPAAVPPPPTPPTPTGDALTDKLNTKRFELASAFVPTSALVKQTLEKGKSQSYQVQLPGPPYCHSYFAVAGDGVTNLDIAIDNPSGTTEAKDATAENVASVLNHCPAMPGAYKLTVSMPEAAGEFAVQVFSK